VAPCSGTKFQWTIPRRKFLGGLAGAVAALPLLARATDSFNFGLTPVFLDSDVELLAMLSKYLTQKLGRSVQLVQRRTYQEITAMLLSGQLDAAWVCDGPYVAYEDKLALVEVPLFNRKPLYQTYIIVSKSSKAQSFDDIRGTVHAFSDPDSTAGYLYTRYLLALRHTTPAEFFRQFFFAYGHQNVIRAVSAGLAESGSIDGYVWEVMKEREANLINGTRIVCRSDWLGFPPIVAPKVISDTPELKVFAAALMDMRSDPLGSKILAILGLDGFITASPALYTGTMDIWQVVRAQA
jgi:phosphonate transport system substrate-binding protein